MLTLQSDPKKTVAVNPNATDKQNYTKLFNQAVKTRTRAMNESAITL